MDFRPTQSSPYPTPSGSPVWSRLPSAFAIGVMLFCVVVGGGIFAVWLRGRPAVPQQTAQKETPLPALVLRGRRSERPVIAGIVRRVAPPFPSEQPAVRVRWLMPTRARHAPSPLVVHRAVPPVVRAVPRARAVRPAVPVPAVSDASAEAERNAARQREAEASALEIEGAAQAARSQVEAEADAMEMRATAAYEAAEAAFARGEASQSMRDEARQMAEEARSQSEALRETARLAEAQELERARRIRQEAGLLEAPANLQAAIREAARASR